MLKRIKLLMLLQMSDKFKIKKVDNVKKFIARIGLITLSLILITAVCFGLFYLVKSVVFILTPKIITFVFVFLQLLSIVACSIGLLRTLYTSKDNSILLSYPAKHFEVFLSKLLVYYVYEFIKSFYTILPITISFGVLYGYFDFVYVISTILTVLVLPIFPVLIGALITIPILYFKKLMDRYPIVKTIFLILVLIAIFYVFFLIIKVIPRPLRIVELYYTFVMGITRLIDSVDSYSLFYQCFGNILCGSSVLINYLIIIGILAALILAVAFISMPLYFSLASSSSEHSVQKKYSSVNVANKNTFMTFVKKEWLLSVRNFGDFLNNYIFLFAMPYVLFIMMGIYTAIDLNSMGVYMTVTFSGFVSLLMCCASNTASALAITKEGSEFVLLKTVPADSSNMAWAKVFFNLIYSSVMIIISYLVVIIFCPMFDTGVHGIPWPWLLDNTWLLLMMITVLLVNAGLVLWSFQIDIMNPKLREYATSGDTSSMNNAGKSILIGLIVSVIYTVLVLLLLLDTDNMIANWSVIIALCVAFFGARLYLFISHLKYIFPNIEY